MRSAGLENSVTSFSLSTHQANNEQYQRRADEAENFVDESQAPEAPPPSYHAAISIARGKSGFSSICVEPIALSETPLKSPT